jgi:hypothetical protein
MLPMAAVGKRGLSDAYVFTLAEVETQRYRRDRRRAAYQDTELPEEPPTNAAPKESEESGDTPS